MRLTTIKLNVPAARYARIAKAAALCNMTVEDFILHAAAEKAAILALAQPFGMVNMTPRELDTARRTIREFCDAHNVRVNDMMLASTLFVVDALRAIMQRGAVAAKPKR